MFLIPFDIVSFSRFLCCSAHLVWEMYAPDQHNQIEAIVRDWKVKWEKKIRCVVYIETGGICMSINIYFDSIWRFHVNTLAFYLCVFELITGHWSNIRKLGVNVARTQQTQNTFKNMNKKTRKKIDHMMCDSHPKQSWTRVFRMCAWVWCMCFYSEFDCIAYEILMWYIGKEHQVTHIQMDKKSQGKSENNFYYSIRFVLFRSIWFV